MGNILIISEAMKILVHFFIVSNYFVGFFREKEFFLSSRIPLCCSQISRVVILEQR